MGKVIVSLLVGDVTAGTTDPKIITADKNFQKSSRI